LYLSVNTKDPAGKLEQGPFTEKVLWAYCDWPAPLEGQRRAPEDPNDKLVLVAGPKEF